MTTAPRWLSPTTAPTHVLQPAPTQASRATSLIRGTRGQAEGGNQCNEARRSRASLRPALNATPDQPGCSCNPGTLVQIKHRCPLHDPTQHRHCAAKGRAPGGRLLAAVSSSQPRRDPKEHQLGKGPFQWALGVVAAGAVATAFQPHIVLATIAFLAMAAALGLGNGAVFALLAPASPRPASAASPGWSGRPAGWAASYRRSSWAWSTRHRRLRDRADAAERRRPRRAGVHRLAPRHGAGAHPQPAGPASSTNRQPEDEGAGDRASEVDRWEDEGGHDHAG
jgi:hypothetical protein